MKKIFVLVLVFALCLTACTQSEQPNPTDGTTVPSAAVQADVFTPPENPGSSLIEYDPDRQIYIACDNVDHDIYLGYSHSPGLRFYIYTKQPLDLSDIQADIPIQNQYRITIAEQVGPAGYTSENAQSSGDPLAFQEYLYACYRGMDWASVLQKELGTEESETVSAEETMIHQDFIRLTAADLPQFYEYIVEIMFIGAEEQYDESFQKMDLIIEGENYHLDIGEIRFHTTFPMEYTDDQILRGTDSTGFFWVSSLPYYNGGIEKAPVQFFTAQEDMELFGFHFLDSHKELLEVQIRISSEESGTFEYVWNTTDRVYLSEGDEVYISVIYRDDDLEKLNYATRIWTVVDYECDAGCASIIGETLLERVPNAYEMYAIVFDGLDMEPYYRDYYYPAVNIWRDSFDS